MASSNIYIFTREIRSGKTTGLTEWLKDKINVSGFLTPDIDGRRMLYDIAEKKYYAFELAGDTAEETVTTGKFNFRKKTFDIAKQILSAGIEWEWLVVDEVGRLETEQDRGLEPALSETVNSFKQSPGKNKLLLVIRASLLENAINKYHLQDAIIIHSLSEIC